MCPESACTYGLATVEATQWPSYAIDVYMRQS